MLLMDSVHCFHKEQVWRRDVCYLLFCAASPHIKKLLLECKGALGTMLDVGLQIIARSGDWQKSPLPNPLGELLISFQS